MSEPDIWTTPARGLHSSQDVRARVDARNAEIQRYMDAGATDETLAAKVSAAADAHAADQAAFAESVASGTAVAMTGAGGNTLAVTEGSLGTPSGDESASMYALDGVPMSTEQITRLREMGLSWTQIAARCGDVRAQRAVQR